MWRVRGVIQVGDVGRAGARWRPAAFMYPHAPCPRTTHLSRLRKGDAVRLEVLPARHLARSEPAAQLGLHSRHQLSLGQLREGADGAD